MDDFSKYFKSMLDQLMKSGMASGGSINFDVNSPSSFMEILFGNPNDKKEKLAVRKLEDNELERYQDLLKRREEIESNFKRLTSQYKMLGAEMEIFWQDMKDSSNLKVDPNQLSIDSDSGFLFQEVNVNAKDEDD